MKSILTLFYMAGCTCLLSAQDAEFPPSFRIKESRIEKPGNKLQVHWQIDVSGLYLPGSRSLLCTPLLEAGDSVRALPSIRLNGRSRHILYRRATDGHAEEPNVYRRHNGKSQTFSYVAEVPFSEWMRKSEITVVFDECGCGWKNLRQNREKLLVLNIAAPVELAPQVCFYLPEVEEVKQRKLDGRAFLDFPVNEIKIYPEYRKNPEELAKIRRTIDEVRQNPYATITAIRIKGYASPEGSYRNNAYLAENRAKALLEYVGTLYDFERISRQVEFEPEDWKGLEKAVESSSLSDREELLAIIRAEEPADWDKREWKLKTLNGGKSYAYLLKDVYPALRHSDYEVDYTIRNFTLEEARTLAFSDPKQLSLGEFYRVIESFSGNPDKQAEAIETAVRLYPSDPVANLNAGVLAIQRKDFEAARRYLERAAELPEKSLAEAVLAMYDSDWEKAEILLERAGTKAELHRLVEENQRQCKAKII